MPEEPDFVGPVVTAWDRTSLKEWAKIKRRLGLVTDVAPGAEYWNLLNDEDKFKVLDAVADGKLIRKGGRLKCQTGAKTR